MRKEQVQNSKLFEKKEEITRKELRDYLKRDTGLIPGGMLGSYGRRERIALEREVFPWRKYGEKITKEDFERAIRNFRGQRYRIKTEKEKIEIERKIRYLKKIAGL